MLDPLGLPLPPRSTHLAMADLQGSDETRADTPPFKIFSLFPSPVLLATKAIPSDICITLNQVIDNSMLNPNSESKLLLHTETQSPPRDPVFHSIGNLLKPYIKAYGELILGEMKDWHITSMWANVMLTGGWQSIHNHVNSFASGIVYLTDVCGNSRTTFHRDPGGSSFEFRNQNTGSKAGQFSSSAWKTPPTSQGDILLFPSYLMHHVPMNEGQSRKTLAFNAVPDSIDCNSYRLVLST